MIKPFHYTELLIVIQQHEHASHKFYGSLLPIPALQDPFTNSESVWRCLELLNLAHFASWVDPTRSMFPNVTQSNIAGWSIQGLPIHTYFTQKLLGPGMLPKTSKTSSNYPFLDTRKGHIHIYVYIFEAATMDTSHRWCHQLTNPQLIPYQYHL